VIDYRSIITIEPRKRSGKPCIRSMRITVGDILGWLSNGMTMEDILADHKELNKEDVYAALAYASDKENKVTTLVV